MSAVVSCDRLSFRARRAELLTDVSLGAEAGEVLAIVGPNGAGKSTLLNLLAGDARPASGSVSWLDRPIATWSLGALAKVRAVVPQHASLSVPFNALEVVLLGRAPHLVGRPESARDVAIARACLGRVGLGAFAERLYTTLSGGEQQRVHLARALAQIDGEGPRGLLLDEPTASLDVAHQHLALTAAREVASSGAAVVAVLHDLGLAAHHADKLAILASGRLRAFGPPRDVLDEALLADVFGIDLRVLPAPWSPSRLLVVAAPSP